MGIIQPKNKGNLNLELKFNTTRVKVFIWVGKDAEPVVCYAFVSEIKKQGISVFATRKLQITSVVLVSFDTKESQPFRAKVTRNQSRVEKRNLQNNSSDWKCTLAFEFASEEECKRYLTYFTELRRNTAMLAPTDTQPNVKIVDGKTEETNLDDVLADLDAVDEPEKGGGESAA